MKKNVFNVSIFNILEGVYMDLFKQFFFNGESYLGNF